jgi:2-methylcitrate dehydratase PrpD
LALRNDHQIAAGDVDHIRVGAARRAFGMLPYGIPRSTMQAKFSMAYCVAAALNDGDVTLASFDDDRIARPDIAALLPKIAMVDDARVREHAQMGSVVRIVLKDGRVLEHQVMIASGKPEKWLTPQRLRSKFMDCAGRAMGAAEADRLHAVLRQLETLPDLSRVIGGLAAARAALV